MQMNVTPALCKGTRAVQCTPDEVQAYYWSQNYGTPEHGWEEDLNSGKRPFTREIQFFSWTDNFAKNINKLRFLQSYGFTDHLTTGVHVILMVWNPHLDVMTKLTFQFDVVEGSSHVETSYDLTSMSFKWMQAGVLGCRARTFQRAGQARETQAPRVAVHSQRELLEGVRLSHMVVACSMPLG